MIRVVWTRDRVTLQGHAENAPRGEDTVCAAVSALVFALAGALEESGALRELVLRPGYAMVWAQEGCEGQLSVLRCGLAQLAGKYPQCVQVE